MQQVNAPTAVEKEKLENIGRGLCPTCRNKIMLVTLGGVPEAVCERCPFSMPKSMYEIIQKQHNGKKDGI